MINIVKDLHSCFLILNSVAGSVGVWGRSSQLPLCLCVCCTCTGTHVRPKLVLVLSFSNFKENKNKKNKNKKKLKTPTHKAPPPPNRHRKRHHSCPIHLFKPHLVSFTSQPHKTKAISFFHFFAYKFTILLVPKQSQSWSTATSSSLHFQLKDISTQLFSSPSVSLAWEPMLPSPPATVPTIAWQKALLLQTACRLPASLMATMTGLDPKMIERTTWTCWSKTGPKPSLISLSPAPIRAVHSTA